VVRLTPTIIERRRRRKKKKKFARSDISATAPPKKPPYWPVNGGRILELKVGVKSVKSWVWHTHLITRLYPLTQCREAHCKADRKANGKNLQGLVKY
jgi:hypothetical protein